MEITGEYRIEAPRNEVWRALNDPEVLKLCIPGCEELEKTSDTEFTAKVKAKVGPVSARFQGAVTLSDLNPPESYSIRGEGKGGAAGFAKGGAKVKLSEDGAATLLHYDVDAQVGGKLAQIGSRLIQGTAKKMANDFFGKFAEVVGAPIAAAAEAAAEAAPAPAAAMATAAAAPAADKTLSGEPVPSDAELLKDVGKGAKPGMWVAALVIVVILLLFIFGLS